MSKAVSQRRWLRQPQNRDYFRGPEQTQRVQQWRKSNPGYWKKKPAELRSSEQAQKSCNALNGFAEPLQDVCVARDPLFIGLLSTIAGSTLQEDIAATIRQLQIQGRKILRQEPSDQCDPKRCLNHGCQKHPAAGVPAGNIDRFWSAAVNTLKRDGHDFDNLILHEQ